MTAPRRVESRPEADYYVIDGLAPFAVGLEGVTLEDKIAGEITTVIGHRHSETRPGASDPQARLADQDLDHLRAEVLYPGAFGLQFWTLTDAAYQRECFRVYNDWLGEFCAAAPERFSGAGLLPLRGPIAWACEEAERAASKGLCSLSIPAEVADQSYADPEFSRLWDTLQDLGLPVSIHSGTTTGEPFATKFARLGMGMGLVNTKISLPMNALAGLIWGALPQRYPRLKFVIVEGGIGWIASLLGLMDHWWKDHHRWMTPKLDEAPSTCFRRQFWATFEDDRAGILTRGLLGVDRLMWGSDYPHTEGTFPHSQAQIRRDFAGVTESEVYQMVAGNAAKLYGLDPWAGFRSARSAEASL